MLGGLIIAIGAQYTFVLKQGLLRQHVLLVALTCWLCDVVLMAAGIWGLAASTQKLPWLTPLLSLVGGLFLLAYGLFALQRAWRGGSHISLSAQGNQPATPWLKTLLSGHRAAGGQRGRAFGHRCQAAVLAGRGHHVGAVVFRSWLRRPIAAAFVSAGTHLAAVRCGDCLDDVLLGLGFVAPVNIGLVWVIIPILQNNLTALARLSSKRTIL